MSKEVEFYEKNEVDYKTKFFRYMDSLVSHKTFSRIESIIFISISYLQLISGLFKITVSIKLIIFFSFFNKGPTIISKSL